MQHTRKADIFAFAAGAGFRSPRTASTESCRGMDRRPSHPGHVRCQPGQRYDTARLAPFAHVHTDGGLSQHWKLSRRVSLGRRRTACSHQRLAPLLGILSRSSRASLRTCSSATWCWTVRTLVSVVTEIGTDYAGAVKPEILKLKDSRGQVGATDCEYTRLLSVRTVGCAH